MKTLQYRTEILEFEKISPDQTIQVRAETNQETVREYYEAMETEEDMNRFPPMTVYFDGGFYRLADGHHRYWAIKRRGYKTVTVRVIDGSRDDAILAAVRLNIQNGLRFNENDWEKIIALVTSKAQWKNWSNRRLAEALGCCDYTIRKYRPSNSVACEHATEKRQGKDGKMYKAKKKSKPKNATTEASATSKTDLKKKKTVPQQPEAAQASEKPQAETAQAETPQTEVVQTEPSNEETPQTKTQEYTIEEAKAAEECIFEMIAVLGQKITEWFDLAPSELYEDFEKRLLARLEAMIR